MIFLTLWPLCLPGYSCARTVSTLRETRHNGCKDSAEGTWRLIVLISWGLVVQKRYLEGLMPT